MARLRRLPDPIDAEWWFRRGDSFLYAVRVMTKASNNIFIPTMFAWTTCAAFCCECYMKVLAQLEQNGPPLEGHDLKALANDLSAKSYQRLKSDWFEDQKKQGIDPKNLPVGAPQDFAFLKGDFDATLEQSARAFIDMRYSEPGEHMRWGLGTLPTTLRALILELRPEWTPSEGPFVDLNPHAGFAETKYNQQVRPTGWAILNRQPPTFNFKTGHGPNPKNRGTR